MSDSDLPNPQENKHPCQCKLYTQTDDMVTHQSFNLTLPEVSVISSADTLILILYICPCFAHSSSAS